MSFYLETSGATQRLFANRDNSTIYITPLLLQRILLSQDSEDIEKPVDLTSMSDILDLIGSKGSVDVISMKSLTESFTSRISAESIDLYYSLLNSNMRILFVILCLSKEGKLSDNDLNILLKAKTSISRRDFLLEKISHITAEQSDANIDFFAKLKMLVKNKTKRVPASLSETEANDIIETIRDLKFETITSNLKYSKNITDEEEYFMYSYPMDLNFSLIDIDLNSATILSSFYNMLLPEMIKYMFKNSDKNPISISLNSIFNDEKLKKAFYLSIARDIDEDVYNECWKSMIRFTYIKSRYFDENDNLQSEKWINTRKNGMLPFGNLYFTLFNNIIPENYSGYSESIILPSFYSKKTLTKEQAEYKDRISENSKIKNGYIAEDFTNSNNILYFKDTDKLKYSVIDAGKTRDEEILEDSLTDQEERLKVYYQFIKSVFLSRNLIGSEFSSNSIIDFSKKENSILTVNEINNNVFSHASLISKMMLFSLDIDNKTNTITAVGNTTFNNVLEKILEKISSRIIIGTTDLETDEKITEVLKDVRSVVLDYINSSPSGDGSIGGPEYKLYAPFAFELIINYINYIEMAYKNKDAYFISVDNIFKMPVYLKRYYRLCASMKYLYISLIKLKKRNRINSILSGFYE